MSRRSLNQTETRKNPATKFLEWKSDEKAFEYYDKQLKEKLLSEGETEKSIKDGRLANVKVELPLKVQFLEHFHTVKGWHDASSKRIYSNEVKFISKEPVNVRTFGGLNLVEGIYGDIKLELLQLGGKYHRSIYVIDESGEIINLQLKGAVVGAYTEFMKDHENSVEGSWLEMKSVTDHKKGATKYSTPDFTIGKAFTKAEMALANEKYLDIVAHFESVTAKEKSDMADYTTEEEVVEDDLAF